MAQIYHTHLYGERSSKYDWLQSHDVLSTDWQELRPQAPFYLMVPQNTDLLSEYEQGWKITDVMPLSSSGMNTLRDSLVVAFDKKDLLSMIQDGIDDRLKNEDFRQKYQLPADTRDWKLNFFRGKIANQNPQKYEQDILRCLYRPFDWRWIILNDDFVVYPRWETTYHFLFPESLGIVTTRQIRNSFSTLASSVPCGQHKIVDPYDRSYVFPLYLYPDKEEITQDRRPNFSSKFLKDITAKLGTMPTPEAIFYYIYSVFHSPTYRSRYAEFLKIDFPRVPLTSNDEVFHQLAAYGEELVSLHLMKSPQINVLTTQFEGNPNSIVDAGHPKYISGKVIINKKGDGFIGVPEDVWNFYVGGYQVCHKWLKDRKGRTLTPEDITHYQRIIVALQETIRLMQQIDEAIPGFPIP